MRFALLCDDPRIEPILNWLSNRSGDHQIAYVVGPTPSSVLNGSAAANIRVVAHWEDLLVARDIDAVIVGGSSAGILEGAKQLAAAGLPIWFVPRSDQGSTFIYELSLIRDDNHVPLVPCHWNRFDAAVVELKQDISAGRLGRIQFLQIARALAKPSSSTPIPLAEVDQCLLPDVDLLRWLIGDYELVTCLRTGTSADGLLMQNVVLAGRSLPEANWSVCPTDGGGSWQLTVRGEESTVTLIRDGNAPCFRYERQGRQVQGTESETAGRSIDTFVSLIGDDHTADPHSHRIDREWSDLVRSFETVDATHRSVRRKRTIELHFEPMSERAIFKTQMTAIGCGLLMATLFLMLLYLGVASFVEPVIGPGMTSYCETPINQTGEGGSSHRNRSLPLAHRLLQVLRLLVFAPLVLFLLAQVLLPLTRPSSNERRIGKEDEETS